jgi:hypothetical protein
MTTWTDAMTNAAAALHGDQPDLARSAAWRDLAVELRNGANDGLNLPANGTDAPATDGTEKTDVVASHVVVAWWALANMTGDDDGGDMVVDGEVSRAMFHLTTAAQHLGLLRGDGKPDTKWLDSHPAYLPGEKVDGVDGVDRAPTSP